MLTRTNEFPIPTASSPAQAHLHYTHQESHNWARRATDMKQTIITKINIMLHEVGN